MNLDNTMNDVRDAVDEAMKSNVWWRENADDKVRDLVGKVRVLIAPAFDLISKRYDQVLQYEERIEELLERVAELEEEQADREKEAARKALIDIFNNYQKEGG